jgi:hypothetical protein
VLITIGVALVRFKSKLDRWGILGSPSRLPLASAVVVALLRVGITLKGLMAYLP